MNLEITLPYKDGNNNKGLVVNPFNESEYAFGKFALNVITPSAQVSQANYQDALVDLSQFNFANGLEDVIITGPATTTPNYTIYVKYNNIIYTYGFASGNVYEETGTFTPKN